MSLNSIFPFAGHSSQTDFEIDLLLFVSLSEGILKFSIMKKKITKTNKKLLSESLTSFQRN